MNKKAYLSIIWTITIIAIVVGVGMRFWGWNANSEIETAEDTEVFDEGFDSVNIDADAADIDVVAGEDYSVEYKLPQSWIEKLEVDEGVLVIKINAKNEYSIKSINSECSIKISVPAEKIGDIDISADYGDIDLEDVSCGEIFIEADAGDISADSVECEKYEVEADLGNVSVTDGICSYISVEADMGNIELSGDFDKVKASCDVGNIEIETVKDTEDVDFDLKADLGNITVNGSKW